LATKFEFSNSFGVEGHLEAGQEMSLKAQAKGAIIWSIIPGVRR
jgi:hypothetical protein